MHVAICTYVRYVAMHAYTCKYTCSYACVYAYTKVHMYTYITSYVHAYMHTYTHPQVSYIGTTKHITTTAAHLHMYVCSNSCMHMYVYMHQSKTFHLKSVICKSFQRIRHIGNLSIRETF